MGTSELIYTTEIESADVENKHDYQGVREGDKLRDWAGYTQAYV